MRPFIGVLFVGFLLIGSVRAEESLGKYDSLIKATDRAHWSFRPVKPVHVPVVKDTAWARNPIDTFVLSRLEGRGWKPAPLVAKSALLRRVTLDLVGLPPTPAEQVAFENDSAPDAYERLVDRLLGSPAHGERWARHWLDVARYADSNGYERDGDKPGSWRYRDWVIRALNGDKPFDRMILEQLAGDELQDANTDSLLATGFLRLGPWDDEPADPKTDRFDQLDDLVSTTSEAFLGLTLACGRCHNHKFDPLTMHDYYRFVAVFDPLDRPRNGRTEFDRPAVPPSRRAELDRLQQRLTVQERTARTAATFSPFAAAEFRRDADSIRKRLSAVPRGYFMEERSRTPPATHLLLRGSPDRPGPKVEPGVPTVLVAKQPSFLSPGTHTTRRRLSLAKWIASGDNPLTARVIVNRVWMHHFGEGLVRTPGDFGTRGEKPTHPELLAWLAGWFVERGWSIKALHRLIVTSRSYRMSKLYNQEYAQADPEHRLLWRFPSRRVEAEVIRDTILAASGQLDRTMYGPGVRPTIQRAALEGHSDPNTIWKADPPELVNRRTIYVHVKRSLVLPLVESLDLCDTTRSAARRPVTTVAPQALMLFNGDFVNEQAGKLADRLVREAGTERDRQVSLGYRLVLGRAPSERERGLLDGYFGKQAKAGVSEGEIRRQFCRVLLNLNEVVYPD